LPDWFTGFQELGPHKSFQRRLPKAEQMTVKEIATPFYRCD